jgi:hypothetical protein
MIELRPETYVGLHIKRLLLVSDLNQNWNMSTNVHKIKARKVKVKLSL